MAYGTLINATLLIIIYDMDISYIMSSGSRYMQLAFFHALLIQHKVHSNMPIIFQWTIQISLMFIMVGYMYVCILRNRKNLLINSRL